MIRHLFKLVWNRKKTNTLIVAEIFCSFLVVFALSATMLYFYGRYTEPLGFDYEDVWQIDVSRNTSDGGDWPPEHAATFRRLLQGLESMEPVVAAAGASTAPYKGWVWITGWEFEKRDIGTEVSVVTPDFAEVLGIELVAGRWITEDDTALDWTAIVVDEDLAADLVGDEDPIGKRVSDADERDYRVVGIVRDYRRAGELDENGSYMFRSAYIDDDEKASSIHTILLKVVPGTRADFEEPMVRLLQSVAHGWTFNVKQLVTARESYLKERLIPLAAIGLVAAFLLLMVVLGLTGVMWQNVTRRTREIGLRRATGAHRARIQRQIVGEVMVTAGLGLIVGGFLAVQVPVVGPFTFVPYAVVLPALCGSAVLILILAALCGLYPGWSATRIQPAEALHYE